MDEVREEIAQAPAEIEEPDEVTEATEPEGQGETDQEESAPDEVENGATDATTPQEFELEVTQEEAAELSPFSEGDAYKIIKDTRLVRVALTDAELVEQGRIMIEAMDEATRGRAAIKAMQADCKANEERALERASEAKSLFRSGHEDRHVDCHQIHNWTRDKVYTVRLDNGEIIGLRPMNSWEKQVEISEPSAEEPEEAQTEIDTEAGQAEPEAEEAPEAQADSDAVDDLDFDGDSEAEGELVGVGAGTGDEEIEIED